MRFSPFNPICFFGGGDQNVARKAYVRTFEESDCLMLEVFYGADESLPCMELIDAEDGELIGRLIMKEYSVNEEVRMGLLERSGFSVGRYLLRLGEYESELFDVVEEAPDTVLVQYAYRTNRMRDDVHNRIFGGIRYFSLRIPGGFKDSGWIFGVDNEQILTPSHDRVELSSIDYTDKILTIGSSTGVDVRTAELVNRILTCPLVFIGPTRYARSEGATLDRSGDESHETFVYSVLLREAHCLNAEMEAAIRLNLRRTPQQLRSADERPRRYS